MIRRACLLSLGPALLFAAAAGAATPATPAAVIAAATDGEWATVDPADLLVMDLAGGRRAVLALAPEFAPAHLANIRMLVRAEWFDGASVERVQDNYVVQWGDPDGRRPLPNGLVPHLPPEYDRGAAGLGLVPLPYRDTFAPRVGFARLFPVAQEGGRAWMAHCYGIVGVGRDMAPDTGNGSELYAVIGQAPRHLDRNLAMVGRVVAGMEMLAALPRGTGDLGVYADPAQRLPIVRARLAADLPAAERPAFQWLRPESASFRAWVRARANRRDGFFVRGAGAVDLCNALPPVRPVVEAAR